MSRRLEPTSPLPTIAHDKRHGNPGVIVYCRGNLGRCPHSGRVAWLTLDLPDDVAVLDIPKHRSFVCTGCGVRNEVEIRSDWRNPLGDGHVAPTWGSRC